MPIRFTLRRATPLATSAALVALAPVAGIIAPAPVYAAQPVMALLQKPIESAPDSAGAVRISIYGDNSGAKVQVRLLASGEDGGVSGYFAAPPVTVDFEGWKTIVLPFSDFVFGSDTNPEAQQDGIGSRDTLGKSTAVQIAITAASSRLFLAGLGWASAGSGPTDALLAPIDLLDAQWAKAGDYDQRRAVAFAKNGQAQFNKDGEASLQVTVKNYALIEKQTNQAAVDARLKASGGFALYTRAPFDPILPETVPTAAEVKAGPAITLTACQDEIESGSFAVYSTQKLTNATVTVVGPFATTTKNTLPTTAIDVRVVRASEVVNGPFLLMKDDRQALSGTESEVRLTGNPTTDVAAGSSKQFWVTVRVPKNQSPGTYKGKLVFSGTGAKQTAIPLTIEVLNLPLKTAFLQYGIDLRTLLSAGEPVPGAIVSTPEQYAAALANIRDHGFSLITLHESSSDLETEMKLYKEAYPTSVGPLIMTQPDEASEVTEAEGFKSSAGLSPALQIYYRLPDSLLSSGAGGHADIVRGVSPRALIIAPVDSSATYTALSGAMSDTSADKLAPIYTVSSDYAQKLLVTGKRVTFNRDYWSWNIPSQSQIRNRLLAGYLIFKTGPGFYGAFPGPYYNVPEGVDPFAAFGADAKTQTNLPQMTVYPVKGGVLDTLQWEAVREGVDDIRYIGVLKGLIRELKDQKRRKDATDIAETVIAGQAAKPLLTLTPEQVQNNRKTLIKESVTLMNILNPGASPKPKPAPPKAPSKPAPAKKG